MSHPLVLALATQRLTQLVVEDEISRPLRLATERWAQGAEEFSFRERLDYIVNCGACSSIYAGAIVMGLDQFAAGRLINRVLALSGAGLGVKAVIDRLTED